MNTTKLEGLWDEAKGTLQKWYGKLTDQDLEYGAKGEWNKLKGAYKQGYGDEEEGGQSKFDSIIDDYAERMRGNKTEGDCGTGCGCNSKTAA